MWLLFAVLSAVFAALTSILAKIGIEGVSSNLATAIRTVVVLVMSWGMVLLTHSQSEFSQVSKKKLAVFNPFRHCNRCVMAVLLLRIAKRQRVKGCSDR